MDWPPAEGISASLVHVTLRNCASPNHSARLPDLLCQVARSTTQARVEISAQQKFGAPQSAEAQSPAGRQVLAALLAANPSTRLRARPALRLLGQPSARHDSTALLSAAGRGTPAHRPFR